MPPWCSMRVYPRERGGDIRKSGRDPRRVGLSPRTRGRRRRGKRTGGTVGSIPANAGETALSTRASPNSGVYPRERGGDRALAGGTLAAPGLSPRTRGRPTEREQLAGAGGSIPANAGETAQLCAVASGCRVYPRERGGDVLAHHRQRRAAGLSPRTRGRHPGVRHAGVQAGSIPANAGETLAQSPNKAH